jgi:hypothetical protein
MHALERMLKISMILIQKIRLGHRVMTTIMTVRLLSRKKIKSDIDTADDLTEFIRGPSFKHVKGIKTRILILH